MAVTPPRGEAIHAATIEVAGLETCVWVLPATGPARELPIVLLHGMADDGRCQAALAVSLSSAGFDVFMPDAPGHGHSALGNSFTPSDRAESLIGVLKHFCRERALLIGHSMGGETAIDVAAMRPDLVRGVIAEEPVLDIGAPNDAWAGDSSSVRDWIVGLQQGTHADRMAWVRKDGPSWREAEYEPWAESKSLTNIEIFGPGSSWLTTEWSDVARRLSVPTIIVRGTTRDRAQYQEQVDAFMRLVPHAIELAIEPAGHCVRRDQPERFAAATLAFAARLSV